MPITKFNVSKQNILVLENAILLFFSSGLNFLLPFLVSSYLIHLLGIEKFGFYSYLLALVGYLQCLIVYGFNLTGTNAIAKIKKILLSYLKYFQTYFIPDAYCFVLH